MKRLLTLVLLILSACGINQKLNGVRTGTFYFIGDNGIYYTIKRDKTNQIEINESTNDSSKYTIKWVNNRTYLLYDRVSSSKSQKDENMPDTLINLITNISKSKHTVVTTLPDVDFTVTTVLITGSINGRTKK